MQLHLFPSRNSSGKMTLSSPVEFDWQGAAKERKWFSKSDLRKTIFFCALTGLLLLQVLQEKQISQLLCFLIRVLLRSPSIADTTLPSRLRTPFIYWCTLHEGIVFHFVWRTWEPLLFLFAETLCCTWKRHREKNLYFRWGRMANSWLPLFFFFPVWKKLLGWLISDLDYHILPVVPGSVYWNF